VDDRITRVGSVADLKDRDLSALSPNRQKDLLAGIESLRKASDAAILAWVSENGFLGVPRGDDLMAAAYTTEYLEDIRFESRQWTTLCRLFDGLRSGAPSRRLRLLARVASHGHSGPWRWARAAHRADLDITAPPRKTLPGDVEALYTLIEELGYSLSRWAELQGEIRVARYSFDARPVVVARSPIGMAYLVLYEQVMKVRLNRGPQGRRLLAGTGLRKCDACGSLFDPRIQKQRWCSTTCRWTGLKREERRAARTRPEQPSHG
jgi:hypothetical protein